jgi:ankyrin repeat protein
MKHSRILHRLIVLLPLALAAPASLADANFDLLAAAARGDVAGVNSALEQGAEVNARAAGYDVTALDAALERQHWSAAESLLDHGAKLDASAVGTQNAVVKLLELEPVLHPKTRNLVQAVELPSPGLFKAVLAQGARTDIKDDSGNTLLMLAAKRHHVTALEALLAAGLDVNARNAEGDTALTIAAGKTEYELIGIAIGMALSPDRDSLMRLVFRPAQKSDESASTARRVAAAKVLLSAMADPNAADRVGNTPLMEATRSGDAELVAMLIKAGARVDARNESGAVPLLTAAQFGLAEIAAQLIAARADTAVHDNEGHSALEMAKAGGHEKVVQMLEQASKL